MPWSRAAEPRATYRCREVGVAGSLTPTQGYRVFAKTLVVRADRSRDPRPIRWRRAEPGGDSTLVRTRITFQNEMRRGSLYPSDERCADYCETAPYFGPLAVQGPALRSSSLGTGPHLRFTRATF